MKQITFFLIVLLSIFVFISQSHAESEKQTAAEQALESAISTAKKLNYMQPLINVVRNYPNTPQAMEANKILVQRANKIRTDSFNNAIKWKNLDKLNSFIKEYPDSPETESAKNHLVALEIDKIDKEIEKAKNIGTTLAFKVLLDELKSVYYPTYTEEGKAYHKKNIDTVENVLIPRFNEQKAEEEFKNANGVEYKLSNFLRKYPKSARAEEARSIIAAIENKRDEERKQQDEVLVRNKKEWESVKEKNSVVAMGKYLKENPQSIYLREATKENRRLIHNEIKASECDNEIIEFGQFIQANPHAIIGKCISFFYLESVQFLSEKTGLFVLYKDSRRTKKLGFIEFKEPVKSKAVRGITRLTGMYTYKTQIGGTNTVPHLVMLRTME